MKVKFTGASDEQVGWGSNDDPRPHLEEGREYELLAIEPHSWHTKVILTDFPHLKFNSVSFEIPENVMKLAINGWHENQRTKFDERKYPYVYCPNS